MTLSFPLSRLEFFSLLPISEFTMDLSETVEVSQSAGGELFAANLGARLWRGTVTLGRLTYAEAGEVEALIDVLREAGNTFMAYDVRRPYPILHPGGAGGAVTIKAIAANNRELSLQGMPAGFVMTRGDYIQFNYGSVPRRTALHRVVVGAVADGAGVASDIEVTPNIRPGASVGIGVDLTRAACKAQIVPGSVNKGSARRGISEGISFAFQQTLRG